MVSRSILVGTALIGLSACASVDKDIEPSPLSDNAADRLAPRTLNPGDCGLFVFSIDQDPRLILFSDNIDNRAAWTEGQGEMQLIITERGGEPALGQFPEQNFTLPDGRTLDLTLVAGEEVDAGTRFPRGTLKLSTEEGWNKVIPVTALAACQTAAN